MLLLLIPLIRMLTNSNREFDTLFVIGMILLTFPSGLLVGIGLGLIQSTTGFYMTWEGNTGILLVLLIWCAYVLTGYLQWFVVCPWCIRQLRSRMAKHQSP